MPTRTLAALLALSLVFVACGDDDTDAGDDPETDQDDGETGAPDPDVPDPDGVGDEGDGPGGSFAFVGEFCADYQTMLAGDPGPDEIRAVAEVAPDEAKDAMETVAAGFEDDPEGYFTTPEFTENFGTIAEVAANECADEQASVDAVDYGFQGWPSDVSAGSYAITLNNTGAEMHEFVVLRKNDGVTESFDEIFAMEDESASEELLTFLGVTFAMPGQSAPGLYDLTAPGEYIAVCFLPVGSTPDAGDDLEGPPHFTQGMSVEFTVT